MFRQNAGQLLSETGSNYDSRWWALIYDRWNEAGGRSQQRERELHFYRKHLQDTHGAILEAACGTGSIMLPLLLNGFDVFGFDVSLPMLEVLRRKAAGLSLSDIDSRITQQNLIDFSYDHPFEAVLIPASSILMLSTQQNQIACLRRVHDCLQSGGRLLLNFYIPSYTEDLLLHQDAQPAEKKFGKFDHPETGRPIEVSHTKICDLTTQTETYTWVFRYDGETVQVPMQARWIYKEEFQLLLRLGGFDQWELYGSYDGKPYVGSEHMGDTYWMATK